jgi:UDP:flavonoid glycosyltransferase YjiC (YdhE family)
VKVLLAWEHGRNLGHVARLRTIALAFVRAGAHVAWAVPPQQCSQLRASGARSVYESPLLTRRSRRDTPPNSYADVLVAIGLDDAEAVTVAVRAWIDLYARERVDMVVLDYAPVAQLAALALGLPARQVTNGFDAPPPEIPLFSIGARGPMLERRKAETIDSLHRELERVGRAVGTTLNLTTLLGYPQRWYDCIPDTDPYGPRQDGLYLGPLGEPPDQISVEWPQHGGDERAFVYLRSKAQASVVLRALAARRARVVCFWPTASLEDLKCFAGNETIVKTCPVSLACLLPASNVVVNYGSSALVCQTVLAGKPQVMWPTDGEKWLVAKKVIEAGLGLTPTSASDVARCVSTLLEADDYASRVGIAARRGKLALSSLDAVVKDCQPQQPSWGREVREISKSSEPNCGTSMLKDPSYRT